MNEVDEMNEFDRQPMKQFNVAGPCMPKEHYMLPATARLPGIVDLICDNQYFLIHASRQSGKTTALLNLVSRLNASKARCALYCSLEAVQTIADENEAIRAITALILQRATYAKWIDFDDAAIDRFTNVGNGAYKIRQALELLAQSTEKSVVVFFDEADCLSETVLVSFLRQLREGYVNRESKAFPSSVALVGMRRIQDYKAHVRKDHETLGTSSPFNVVSKSLTLRSFTKEDVVALYAQHTAETGQVFEEAVYDEVMHWTGGQPWLVNAIARECVQEIHGRRYDEPICVEDIRTAKETIIRRRDTHILSLLARLDEARVRRIVKPVLTGEVRPFELDSPDVEYVLDLGLLKLEKGSLEPSNQMYAEMISRYLTWGLQNDLLGCIKSVPWITSEGLDMNWLVRDFQTFWREEASAWKEWQKFAEAGPHILFMAFLQRVVNGGGNMTREMALGSYRLDIGLEFMGRIYAIEIKLKEHFRREKALVQLRKYLDYLNASEGWLLVFDGLPPQNASEWVGRLSWEDVCVEGKTVHLVGF